MASLGCGTHTAIIADRVSGHKLLQIEKPLRVKWSRVRNDMSWAEVVVSAGDCCAELSQVESMRHELLIYRGRELVWQGTVSDPVSGAATATIRADDGWWWLDGWYPRQDLELSGTVTSVALQLIEHGRTFPDGAPDDTGVMSSPTIIPSRIRTTREYEAYRSSVGALLRQLSGNGLNMTFLGRRLLMWGNEPLGRTNMLQDKDFLGDIEVTKSGSAAASRVIVLGQEGVIGIYGGTDSYYGMRERVVNDPSITDNGVAAEVARLLWESGMPPPKIVSLGNQAVLTDTAPVSIAELVPGMVVPLWTAGTCFRVYQDLVLDRVEVEEWADEGERVAISVSETERWGAEEVSGVLG